MDTKRLHQVPGPNEPDPMNIRQNSFQGGADGLSEPPTMELTYGDMKYEDGEGPFAGMSGQTKGAGLSGSPQADAGIVSPQYNDPDSPRIRVNNPYPKV